MDQDGERLSGCEGFGQETPGVAALDPDETPASPSSRGRTPGASGSGVSPGSALPDRVLPRPEVEVCGTRLSGQEGRTMLRGWSPSLPSSGLTFWT